MGRFLDVAFDQAHLQLLPLLGLNKTHSQLYEQEVSDALSKMQKAQQVVARGKTERRAYRKMMENMEKQLQERIKQNSGQPAGGRGARGGGRGAGGSGNAVEKVANEVARELRAQQKAVRDLEQGITEEQGEAQAALRDADAKLSRCLSCFLDQGQWLGAAAAGALSMQVQQRLTQTAAGTKQVRGGSSWFGLL